MALIFSCAVVGALLTSELRRVGSTEFRPRGGSGGTDAWAGSVTMFTAKMLKKYLHGRGARLFIHCALASRKRSRPQTLKIRATSGAVGLAPAHRQQQPVREILDPATFDFQLPFSGFCPITGVAF